jgi:hypothetical protein
MSKAPVMDSGVVAGQAGACPPSIFSSGVYLMMIMNFFSLAVDLRSS